MAKLKEKAVLLLLLLLYPVICVAVLLRYLSAVTTGNHYRAWRIAVGVDQLGNVAANGNEDETISSRAARSQEKGERWACVLCKLLDVLDPDHCKKSRGV